MTPAIITTTVPAEQGHAVLACSATLGCAVTLPAGERITNVTVGDERYAVRVQSDGTSALGRVLVYPMRTGASETRLDVLGSDRAYVVIVEPVASSSTRVLAFTARPPLPPRFIPAVAPTPGVDESAALEPQNIAYSWRYRGDPQIACQGVFEYRRSAVWCKLPPSLLQAPSVYALVGREYRPVDSRIVDRSYLVIESTDGPFEIDALTNGAQHRGTLEHAQ